MALRDQPYIPFYVQDFLTDEKLTECSASATGIYIRIMCLMHKSEHYGKILLKQKHKQTGKQISDFAKVFAKVLPYPESEILLGLEELVSENVLILDGDFLIQKRMVRDNEISVSRSEAGKNGVIAKKEKNKKGKNFADTFAKAKHEANSENEYVNENESENKNVVELSKDGFFLNDLPKDLQLSEMDIGKTIQFVKFSIKQDVTESQVAEYWEAFKIQWFEKKEWKNSIEDLMSHFRNSFKQQKFNQHESAKRSTGSRNSPDLSLLGDNREPL